jgi:hypothetical protein
MKKAFVTVLLGWVSVAALGAVKAELLPSRFAGWQKSRTERAGQDPAAADPANAALLKEYGFSDFEQAIYTEPDRRMSVKAARFADASGAYGAFTFYRQSQMLNEKIGDQGASADTRILFYRGNVLVDASLDRVTAMSAADLRELANELPLQRGNALNAPILPSYLPKQAQVRNSAKYVLGPIGLGDVDSPLSASLVNFNTGAEVALGRYSTEGGQATLMIIGYPTPQIAGERLRTIEGSASASGGGSAAPAVFAKRTGPYLVVASGQISSSEAKSLLGSVNYDADVTWNENTYSSKRDNMLGLLVGVILLAAILMGAALILGLFFGGFRILMKRFFPDRFFDRSRDVEIISLKLSE